MKVDLFVVNVLDLVTIAITVLASPFAMTLPVFWSVCRR